MQVESGVSTCFDNTLLESFGCFRDSRKMVLDDECGPATVKRAFGCVWLCSNNFQILTCFYATSHSFAATALCYKIWLHMLRNVSLVNLCDCQDVYMPKHAKVNNLKTPNHNNKNDNKRYEGFVICAQLTYAACVLPKPRCQIQVTFQSFCSCQVTSFKPCALMS